MVLAETWLNLQETHLYQISSYNAIHSCRESRGGGVSVYVRDSIKCQEVKNSCKNEELNWVCVTIGETGLKLSAIYRPPSYPVAESLQYLETILQKFPKRHIIVGDFNINLLDSKATQTVNYNNLVIFNNFTIKNVIREDCATRLTDHSKSIIDHVLTDRAFVACGCINIEDTPISDHRLLTFHLKDNIKVHKPKILHEVKMVNYKKFQHSFIQNLKNKTIKSFQSLIEIIKSCKDHSTITKKIKIRKNNEWINGEILAMMKERDKIYKKKLKYPDNAQLKVDFKEIKNKINNKIKTLKNQFFRSSWANTGNNVKKQWRFINRFYNNRDTATKVKNLNIDGNNKTDIGEIVMHFNDHFSRVGKNIVSELNRIIESIGFSPGNGEVVCGNTMFVELTNVQEVREIISELKQNAAPGHDAITVRDIMSLRDDLIPILTKLINNCLELGIFPEELKIGKITPIYKSGSRDCMHNYRPITVVSVFSKIIEKIIKKRMISFIQTYVQADRFQYGFSEGSSTLCAAMDLTDHISRALDNKQVVIAVFIDLQKAFDVVSTDILLNKLDGMGFRGVIYNLLKSYVQDRKQYVSLSGVNSSFLNSECGVPQGSVLGPLLYLLYVLNLKHANLRAQYFTFADDTVLVYAGEEEGTLTDVVNDDLKLYLNWLYRNKLKINIGKTKYMVFKQKNKSIQNLNITMDNVALEEVQCIKYLGLMVDNKLGWKEHISYLRSKLMPMIPIIFKSRSYLSEKTKYMVYNSFFLSHLRYLLPIWGTCSNTDLNTVKVMQNKILKILFHYDRLTSTETLYSELRVPKIDVLLELEQIKIVYKFINKTQKSNIPIRLLNEVHIYDTRSQNNIYTVNTRTNIGLHNPFTQACKVYNRIPDNIKNIGRFPYFVKRTKMYLGIN